MGDNSRASQYEKYNWSICEDLKFTALWPGWQVGCTKLCRFLCEWGNWDRKYNYI